MERNSVITQPPTPSPHTRMHAQLSSDTLRTLATAEVNYQAHHVMLSSCYCCSHL